MNDTQRLNLIDRLILDNGDMIEIRGRSFFTGITQHQTGASVREIIDTINDFMKKRRCWKCENNHGCAIHNPATS